MTVANYYITIRVVKIILSTDICKILNETCKLKEIIFANIFVNDSSFRKCSKSAGGRKNHKEFICYLRNA